VNIQPGARKLILKILETEILMHYTVRYTSQVAYHTGAYPSLCSNLSDWEYFLLPLEGMLVHRRVTPALYSPVPIYKPGWREVPWE